MVLDYEIDALALPRRGLLPASRDAGCSYPKAEAPCRVTNGVLDERVTFGPGVQEVVIQLSRPVVPRKAVVRNLMVAGASTGIALEGSLDGLEWSPLLDPLGPSQWKPFMEWDLQGTTPVTQVRLRTTSADGSGELDSLGQVSLFE